MKTPKTFRLGWAANQDIQRICKALNLNQTEAVEWAVRIAAREAERIEIETKVEYHHGRSPD